MQLVQQNSYGVGKMRKPKVGDTVVIEPIGNEARYGNKEPIEIKVSKVGRKYFSVEHKNKWERAGLQFNIADWRQKTDCSACWICHESMQSYLDKIERVKINTFLSNKFDWRNRHDLSLDQLRRIKAIFDENIDDVSK